MLHELWTASCVLLVFGLAAELAGIFLKSYSKTSRIYDGYAVAEVVDIIAEARDTSLLSEFHNRQAAVFEFYAEGKLVKVVDPEDTYPCPYHLHQRVRICYNQKNPRMYRVIHRDTPRFAAMALNVLGIVLIMGGCALFLLYAVRAGGN